MLYTLDTNAVAALLKSDPKVVSKAKQVVTQHTISLNAICYYETKRGLILPTFARKFQLFQNMLVDWHVLPIDLAVLDEAVGIHQYLRQRGTPLEDADILMAATAIVHNATLVTRNTKHFSRIPNLKLENWEV